MLKVVNLESLAGVYIHISSVKRKGLTHIFSRPKIRSPNVDVGADFSVCPP